MRLWTIWTLPAATLRVKIYETGDWTARTIALYLPKRVKYWAFIHVGVTGIGDRVVTDVSFVDVLADVDGGPR